MIDQLPKKINHIVAQHLGMGDWDAIRFIYGDEFLQANIKCESRDYDFESEHTLVHSNTLCKSEHKKCRCGFLSLPRCRIHTDSPQFVEFRFNYNQSIIFYSAKTVLRDHGTTIEHYRYGNVVLVNETKAYTADESRPNVYNILSPMICYWITHISKIDIFSFLAPRHGWELYPPNPSLKSMEQFKNPYPDMVDPDGSKRDVALTRDDGYPVHCNRVLTFVS